MAPKNNQYHPQIAFHPGETLAEKLEELGMGPKEFAIRTGKPEKTVIAILKAKSSITPEMAVQFEHVLKIPAHFWLNMQRSYDEFLARKERREILSESTEWAKKFPIADMVKKGWLPAKTTIEEKTSELLAFFSISNHTAWEDYYFNQQLKVAFRISLAHTKEPYAISAWLRKGELQAAELTARPYDEKSFKGKLAEIKNLMAKHPENFFKLLQDTCLSTGVKVVHTPCINKAPINGSTRWLNDTPLIQLTGRYKRNDSFWFTFFHEAGHILLHGKKDIFLENIDYSDKDKEKEKEADNFAIKWTLSKEEQAEILRRFRVTEDDVIEFAAKFNTHPAIIIGRLQYEGLVSYAFGRQFFEPITFE
ncbi:MAG: HigA family addiction module antitoxin [Bacteroidia bacterium]|nr:HigA family addiction module antitoxin [Bacteroidia bacterium]